MFLFVIYSFWNIHYFRRCSRKHITIAFVIGFFVAIVLVIAILLPLLIKTKQSTTPILRWYREGVTVAGVTNVTGTATTLLNWPFGIAIDWSYTLYVGDRWNYRVQKFLRGSLNATTAAGRANGSGGSALTAFSSPGVVLVDDDSNIHVADMYNYRVMLWKKAATTGIIAAGNGMN